MPLVIRPATKADLDTFYAGQPRPTISAYVGDLDGKIVGIGGLAYVYGRVNIFCDLTKDARRFKIAMHRIGLMLMQQAMADGHRFVYADADMNEPTSDRWLRRLGFAHMGGNFYRWAA